MTRLMMLFIALPVLAGCGGQAEKCNAARVAAHEAWRAVVAPVGSTLTPLLRDPGLGQISSDAQNGLGGIAVGQATDVEMASMSVQMCVDDHFMPVARAASAIADAADAANGKAMAARDSAHAASTAVAAVGTHPRDFDACVARALATTRTENYEFRQRVAGVQTEAHALAVAFATADVARAAAAATAASNASWEACQTVDP